MELFTKLARHSQDLESLQGRLGLHTRSARDFLDALVALKFLERREVRYYNTPSLNMLIETNDGFDYTAADCAGWMKEAGFRETQVEHLVGPDSMVIGIK